MNFRAALEYNCEFDYVFDLHSSRDYHSLSNGHKKTNTHDIIHIELSELCECDNEIIYIRRKIMQHMCVLLTRQKL